MHKAAKDVAGSIIETYYKDVDIPELEMDTALLNIQQHIGIDLNLFNSDLGKRDEYDPKNLIDMSSEKPEEEKPAEGESKNA